MVSVVEILVGLVIILAGAKLFTNSIEWVGKKLKVTKGAVGSIFAAVGTALPETMVPVVAIVFGAGTVGHEIGIGAILGAPFMLSTVAFVVIGAAAILSPGRESQDVYGGRCLRRDLGFFMIVFPVAVGAAYVPPAFRSLVVVFLILAYLFFVYRTFREGECYTADEMIEPLLFARRKENPRFPLVVFQVLTALGAIIFGARVFVDGVTFLATELGVPALLFSLLIAPVATEMPEKFNSVIWIGEDKDTLALGNVTGAMVFQSSLITALGIALTPWELTGAAFASAALATASAFVAYMYFHFKGRLSSRLMIAVGGGFYGLFILAVVAGLR
ncbi:MAG: sodium:calcium antiporter [Candidatus Desulforudis sp.]|nr:sodium:calcium antiporter [Desulforudis sp.]